MAKPFLKWGDWNAICDICGFRFKASELTKDWQGLMVCKQDYEQRHPQDFLRVRPDNPAVPWSRPEGADQFINPACWLWEQSAYADIGGADCMRADFTPLTFAQMLALKFPTTIGDHSSIPALAIPGFAVPTP